MDLVELFKNTDELIEKEIKINGWIRNHRKQKEFGFIDFSDGTCFKHLQVVYDNKLVNFEDIQKMHVGCAIEVVGTLVKSLNEQQDVEVNASSITLLGDCPEDYPIQPKRHTREFLREQA